ncbi:MAG: hypothetical protein HC854_13380 [Flavobacterium sp.]|nr:hypothetical protein [Flavobacterium sp.]
MKKIIFTALIFISFSCNENNKNKTESDMELNIKNIYTTKQVDEYIKYNNEIGEYVINIDKEPLKFDSKQLSFPLKENEFGYNKSEIDVFYELYKFNLDNNYYKIIIYNSYGK